MAVDKNAPVALIAKDQSRELAMRNELRNRLLARGAPSDYRLMQ